MRTMKPSQHTHVIVARVPERHLAFPDLCRLADGALLVVYREANDHWNSPSRIMVARCPAPLESLEFEPPQVVCETDLDDRDPSVTQVSNGSVLINFVRYRKETVCLAIDGFSEEGPNVVRSQKEEGNPLAIVRSFDGGLHWAPPQDMTMANLPQDLGYRVATTDAILELPSGECLMPIHNGTGSFILRTKDGGGSWPEVTPLAVAPSPIFEEPALARLEDGRLLALLRTDNGGDGSLYQTISCDEGRTWSPPERLGLWGFPAHLLPLTNGRVLATYGYRRNPFGVRYCLARRGPSWSLADEYALRNDGHSFGDLGYPSSVELENGEVFTVYYFAGIADASSEYTYIAGTRYKPK